jgi:ABC-type transport system involved in multi-copper enzyme maturation permease subunit
MNPLKETWLVAARDCRRSVRSFKGVAMASLSVLAALAATFKLPKFEEAMDDVHKLDPEQLREIKLRIFGKLYGDEATGRMLADAPVRLVILFFIAVWLAPLLVMIVGFDNVSSDLQHRAVRFLAIRTRRGAYYAGKFLALWAVVAAVTLFMQLMIWGVTIVRADAPAGETVLWGLRFWATSLPISGAWCGLATLAGSPFRTPMLSLLGIASAFFVLFFAGFIVGKGGDVAWLRVLYPNNWDGWILGPTPLRVAEGLGACFGSMLVTVGFGAWAFAQRDV